MPVDYSKWSKFDAEEDEETLKDDEPKEWSEMSAAERQAVHERMQREEEEVAEKRRAHELNLKRIQKDAEIADESWTKDVDMDSYEDFTIKRTWRVVKPKGAICFKVGHYSQAEAQWLGGLELIKKVGMSWPTASELYVQLKCNLAQLYLKQERWDDAKQVATAAINVDPDNEKARYRRALVRMHHADWNEARLDLEHLLRCNPNNSEAKEKFAKVRQALKEERGKLHGAGVKLSAAMKELTADGTLRKISILSPGKESPEDMRWMWPWGREEWLGTCIEKAVLTLHVVVRSMGGEELFTTRGRMHLPETPEERDQMRVVMQQVAQLDDQAGKLPRKVEDFYSKEAGAQPMRWRYGDPSVYSGLELAARSMMLEEKALFEIDQPLLGPSVKDFYSNNGGAARVAGLPDLTHHIEERKLNLLAEEMTEWELDLESKTQRTVRVELELLKIQLYRDISPRRNGEYLIHVVTPGRKDGRPLMQGAKVEGDFVIAGALSGKSLYRVESAIWFLGREGHRSEEDRQSVFSTEPMWIPKCIGQALQDAGRGLREGAMVEARLQYGPTPWQLNPTMARKFDWKRATEHRPPVALSVKIERILADG